MRNASASNGGRRDLVLVLPVAALSTFIVGAVLAMGASALYVPDSLVAHPPEPREPALHPWNLTLDELERDYPIVARAIRAPGTHITIEETDRPVLEAFFTRINELGHDAVRADGADVLVSVVMPDLPGDGEAVITGSEGEPSVPALGGEGPAASEAPAVGLVLSLLASVGALLWVRRM